MKVLQLIQKPQPRGAETFAAQLTLNLQTQGVDSKIVSLFDSADADNYKAAYSSLSAATRSRLIDIAGWKKLAEEIENCRPNVIQANAGDTLKYAVFSKIMFRWPQPIVFRNASTPSLYINSRFQKLYNKLLYRRVSAIASVSEHSKKDLLKLFPELKHRTTVVPIGLEEKRAVANPYERSSANLHRLVHVGGFSFEKDHAGLLRIFKNVLSSHPDSCLWMVGDGPLRTSVEEQVAEMGLENKVQFTGFVNNPLDFIAYADVLLLPSIIEGLPGVILEALLYQTPVVAYNVGGIGEVLRTGETGWLVNPQDEDGFVAAVKQVLTMEEATKECILACGYSLVREHYMNSQIAQKFIQLYKSLF